MFSRIVALSPALVELIFSLHLQKKLVGVSDHSDYPPQAQSIQSVGPYIHPFFEKIVALKPDLVLLSDDGPQDVQLKLDQTHITYRVVPMRRLADIPHAAKQLGELLHQQKQAEDFSKEWQKKLKSLPRDGTTHSAVIVVQTDPLMVAGKETFLTDGLKLCGDRNEFAEIKGYQLVNSETALLRHPDRVIVLEHFDSDSARAASEKKLKQTWRHAEIHFFNPDLTSRPGSRFLKGLESICEFMAKGT